jgi:hypothetical protein
MGRCASRGIVPRGIRRRRSQLARSCRGIADALRQGNPKKEPTMLIKSLAFASVLALALPLTAVAAPAHKAVPSAPVARATPTRVATPTRTHRKHKRVKKGTKPAPAPAVTK